MDSSDSKTSAEPEASRNGNERVIHEVDGIRECDNRLPNWWLATLWGSVLFAAVYWTMYQSGGFAKLPGAELEAEIDRRAAVEAERAKAQGVVTPEMLVILSKDKVTTATGRDLFVKTCTACHRDDGGGNVGPNLTDEFWLHGNAPDAIYKTVESGVVDKGMPAWGPQLGRERIQAVVAYVLTLRGLNVPNGKAPQGERMAAALP